MSPRRRCRRSARSALQMICAPNPRHESGGPTACSDSHRGIARDPRPQRLDGVGSVREATHRRANQPPRCCQRCAGSREIGQRCTEFIKFASGLRVLCQMRHDLVPVRSYLRSAHVSCFGLGQLAHEGTQSLPLSASRCLENRPVLRIQSNRQRLRHTQQCNTYPYHATRNPAIDMQPCGCLWWNMQPISCMKWIWQGWTRYSGRWPTPVAACCSTA